MSGFAIPDSITAIRFVNPFVLMFGIKLLEELLTQGALELEGPRAVDWSPDMEATSGSDCFLCHRRHRR